MNIFLKLFLSTIFILQLFHISAESTRPANPNLELGLNCTTDRDCRRKVQSFCNSDGRCECDFRFAPGPGPTERSGLMCRYYDCAENDDCTKYWPNTQCHKTLPYDKTGLCFCHPLLKFSDKSHECETNSVKIGDKCDHTSDCAVGPICQKPENATGGKCACQAKQKQINDWFCGPADLDETETITVDTNKGDKEEHVTGLPSPTSGYTSMTFQNLWFILFILFLIFC